MENPTQTNQDPQASVEAPVHSHIGGNEFPDTVSETPMEQLEEMANQPESEYEPEPEPEKPKRKGLKILLLILLLIILGALGYYAYKNPELFRASITEISAPTGSANMYIPIYQASATDSGNIAIKTQNVMTAEKMYSLKFKLKYSPTTALSFDQNSIIFDTGTLFQSADLKSVTTSTPGEVVVSFFSSTGVTVPTDLAGTTDDSTLVKLSTKVSGTAGSDITMSVSDVEAIVEDTSVGATIPYKVSTQFTKIDAEKMQLVTQNNLRVLNAEALDSTHVLVRFSDLLKAQGSTTDYTISGPTVSAVESGYGHTTFTGYDQSTVILTTSSQTAGEKYAVTASGSTIYGNTKGGLDTSYTKGFFDGYQNPDGVTNSTVELSSISVTSSSQVTLNFSGALDSTTVTPINIEVFDSSATDLTVSSAVASSSSVVTLTTAQQTADKNYFVRLNGVEDSSGLPLVNNVDMNFLGYKAASVSVTSVSPKTVTNDADRVVALVGSNLDSVDKALIGSTDATIIQQTSGALSLTVPKDFTAGIYDIKLIDKSNVTTTLTGALAVTTPVKEMQIISESSKAIPNRIPPDGKTNVTFWVLVYDTVDIANIDSVTIDLEKIGGNRAQEMTKDTGLQPQYKQFYTYTTTVAATTSTQTDPYKLAVQVRKGSKTVDGTVSLYVTNDVYKSVAPTIDSSYISPTTVPPDGKTTAKISAKISDLDGINTVTSVVADLGTLGAGFVQLKNINSTSSSSSSSTTSSSSTSSGSTASTSTTATTEQTTGYFASDTFTIPTTAEEKSYTVTITATDSTGESSTSNLTINVSSLKTGPTIDSTKSYIAPTKSVPRDGKTPFTIHVMVSDQDGISDITDVTAYSSSLGLTPVSLTSATSSSSSTTSTAKSALFSSGNIVVPTTAIYGVHQIQVVATDSTGTTGGIILQIDVASKDMLGDSPRVYSTKSYTTPKVAINDGKTSVTLYAFVSDDDDDLDYVVANLSKIGQVGSETTSDFTTASSSSSSTTSTSSSTTSTTSTTTSGCTTNSKTIVCMTPSFKVGSEGQWFVLSDVTVSTGTSASSTPYQVEIIATDKGSKVGRGYIPVTVRSSQGYTADKNPPKVLAAVPTAPGKIEILFNEELSSSSISSDGSEFTITEKSDVSKTLSVVGATINATGDIVTLTTGNQTSGKDYVVNVSSNITDVAGVGVSSGTGSRAYFEGFTSSTKGPVVHYVSATDTDTVEIEFQEDLRPSSVKLGTSTSLTGGDFDFKVFESDTSTSLPVYGVQFLDSGKSIELTTATMKSGARYSVQIEDIASAGGVQLKSPVAKFFKAIKISSLKQAAVANQADLNGDGKVDFIDFTMFSAVYGQTFSSLTTSTATSTTSTTGTSTSGTTSTTTLSPITPVPNATVPTTSVPTGGTVSTTSTTTPTTTSTTTPATTSTTTTTTVTPSASTSTTSTTPATSSTTSATTPVTSTSTSTGTSSTSSSN